MTTTASAADYHRVHGQLRARRGPASVQACEVCGQPAVDWAYDRKDPDERRAVAYTGRTVTFSLDLEHYVPLCKPCHHLLDHPPKSRCANGHALTPENTYVRPNGGKLCRTCKRESLRRWRAEHPDWRQGVSA